MHSPVSESPSSISPSTVHPEFRFDSTQKYVITEKGEWRPAGKDEARSVNTKTTLDSLSSRCGIILNDHSKANEARNTQEIEQHLQNTMKLANKVIKHARKSWDWIPLIGKFFGNIAEERVVNKFRPVVEQLQKYLNTHGTDVLARSKPIGLVSGDRGSGISSWIAGVARQVLPLAPMAQHVENLFRDGAKYGFLPEKLQYPAQAEDILKSGGGHEVDGMRFLYWRRPEDTSTFQVSTLRHNTVYQFTVAVYDKGRDIQYDFGEKSGRAIPSLNITKEHPDFPRPEQPNQFKVAFIQDQLRAFSR